MLSVEVPVSPRRCAERCQEASCQHNYQDIYGSALDRNQCFSLTYWRNPSAGQKIMAEQIRKNRASNVRIIYIGAERERDHDNDIQ